MDSKLQGDELHTPDIEDIFSLRRPKDIRAGLASGLKSVGKGIVGGAVGLLAAPVVGAATEGLSGFAKGVAAGVAGAVLLPATGVTVGIVQVARGVVNQPEALVESIRGKTWDKEQRCWVDQPACAIAAYDKHAASQRQHLGLSGLFGQQQQQRLQQQQQLDYYELLEVSRDATPQEIKRQYYILARRQHPDKNVGDPQAHERFQQLAEAYQVLSTPDLRKRYDQAGLKGLEVDFMDAAAFYTALFGSEMFSHLVGELMIARVARSADSDDMIAGQSAELQEAQAARVEQLAIYLTALLRRYVEGDVEGFKLAMRLEAERLAAASFGATMLHCIGAAYCSQADIYLGGLLGGTWARMRLGREAVRSHLDIANAALKVMHHQEKVAAFDRQCEERRHRQQLQQQQQQQPAQEEQQPLCGETFQQQEDERQQPEGSYTSDTKCYAASDAAAEAVAAGSEQHLAKPVVDDTWDALWFGNGSSPGSKCTSDSGKRAARRRQQQQQQVAAAVTAATDASPGIAGLGSCQGQPPAWQQHQQQQDIDCLNEQQATASVWSAANSDSSSSLQSAGCCQDQQGPYSNSNGSSPGTCYVSVSCAHREAAAAAAAVGISGGDKPCCESGADASSTSLPPQCGGPLHSSNDIPFGNSSTGGSSGDPDPDAAASANLEELLHRSQLEDVGMRLFLEAMWAANVVDIRTTLRKVCQAVLHDSSASSVVRQLRAEALREVGAIFCSVQQPSNSPTDAKQQMQAAYEAVIAKQMAENEREECW